MLAQFIDGIVSVFSPKAGIERRMAREALRGDSPYEGAELNRLLQAWLPKSESGDTPNYADIQWLRQRAFDLYRNNVHYFKAVRAFVAQVVGLGLKPESTATLKNGDPDQDFRDAAQDLWKLWGEYPCISGKPGQGGYSFAELQALVAREICNAGEVLIRKVYLDPATAAREGRAIPFALQIIEAERLAEEMSLPSSFAIAEGNTIFRGIETDSSGRRVAYHIHDHHPASPQYWIGNPVQPKRIPAADILHVFVADRPNQMRGVPLCHAAIKRMKQIEDYEHSEIIGMALAACVVMGITKPSGSGSLGALATPVGKSGVDRDGNTGKRMQPGMIVEMSEKGALQGFNPQRPASNAESFIGHLLRGVAGSIPGLKPSTITGDYRQASYSSEKAADNDSWREVEQMQDWLIGESFCQPLWEEVITLGVLSGWFTERLDGRRFSIDKYMGGRASMVGADWNGPVAKSTNPKDDQEASKLAIEQGTSDLTVESASNGLKWRTNIQNQVKVYEYCIAAGVPDDVAKLKAFGKEIEPPKPAPSLNANGSTPSQSNRIAGYLNGSAA